MAIYQVAHVREGDEELIIVHVSPYVARDSMRKHKKMVDALEACAHDAGMTGSVALVWKRFDSYRDESIGFFGPAAWHPFLMGLTFHWLGNRLNRTLRCD